MTAAERSAKLTGRFVTPRRRPGACLSTLLHDGAPFALMQQCHTWSIEFFRWVTRERDDDKGGHAQTSARRAPERMRLSP